MVVLAIWLSALLYLSGTPQNGFDKADSFNDRYLNLDNSKTATNQNPDSLWYVAKDQYGKSQYTEALKKYQAVATIYAYDSVRSMHLQRNIGLCYAKLGEVSKATSHLNRARSMAKQLKEVETFISVTINLINLLEDRNAFKEAFEMTYNLRKESLSTSRKAQTSNLLGNLFFRKNQYDSAVYWYQEAAKLYESLENQKKLSISYNNLGESYLLLHRLDSANAFLAKSFDIREASNDPQIVSTINNLAFLHIKKDNLSKAKTLLAQSSLLLKGSTNERELLKLYSLQKTYNEKIESYEDALYWDQLKDALSAKMFEDDQLKALRTSSAFELQSKENEIKSYLSNLELEILKNRTSKRWNVGLSIGLLIVGILLTLTFSLYRKNKRLRHKNEGLLAEQNHRVKNNLQMIKSLLSLHSQGLRSKDAQEALEESQSRIQSVALLHRLLYKGESVGEISLEEYVKSLFEEFQNATGKKADLELKNPEDFSLSIEKGTSVGLIINELFTNSVKHASSPALAISLEIVSHKSRFQLNYKDNGKSFRLESWNNTSSFGKQLIDIQSQQLRGSYTIADAESFNFKLEAPI